MAAQAQRFASETRALALAQLGNRRPGLAPVYHHHWHTVDDKDAAAGEKQALIEMPSILSSSWNLAWRPLLLSLSLAGRSHWNLALYDIIYDIMYDIIYDIMYDIMRSFNDLDIIHDIIVF